MLLTLSSAEAQRLPLFGLLEKQDPSARKHGGAATSQAAHRRFLPAKRKTLQALLKLFRQAGPVGLTAKEVALALGKPLNAVSGRVTELRQWGFIQRLDQVKRDESAVHIHRRFQLGMAATGKEV